MLATARAAATAADSRTWPTAESSTTERRRLPSSSWSSLTPTALLALVAFLSSDLVAAVPAPATAATPTQLGHTFRQDCSVVLDDARIDPLVAPGAVSSHAHTIAGASGFSPTAAFDSLQKSSCSSCVVSADKSNYWSPPLFYINQNKTYTYIPTGVTTYYEVRGKDYNYEFPKGFGMIVGNYLRRGLTGNQTDRAISWLCIGGTNVNNGEAQPIPQSCTGDIRAQVQFPVCNDGRLFTKDGSHMSFAYNKDGTINFDGGSCPPTHPKRFVKLFVEVLYKAGDLKRFPFHTNKNEPRFVLSTGDVMGYSFHVDFLNGWKTGVLQNIIDNCDYGGGFNFFDPSNCKYIKDNFYQTNAVRTTCRVTDSAVVSKQEALVYNPSKGSVAPFAVSRLPGCNPVQATPFTGTCSAANLVASSSSKAAVAESLSESAVSADALADVSAASSSTQFPPANCKKTYTIISPEFATCSEIALASRVTIDKIKEWNKGGDLDCDHVRAGVLVCVLANE